MMDSMTIEAEITICAEHVGQYAALGWNEEPEECFDWCPELAFLCIGDRRPKNTAKVRLELSFDDSGGLRGVSVSGWKLVTK